jgi:hypothetical protein
MPRYRKAASLAADPAFTATYAPLGGVASVVALTGTGIDTTGAADSSAAIQALATANPGKLIRVLPGATYKMSNRLVLKSGTTLDLSGATLNWIGWNGELIVNSAMANPQRTVADAVTTATSTTVTSATAAFTSADVGRSVTIAGAWGSGNPMAANITAVTDAQTVTLDTPAATTTSGAALSVYDRDSDIAIIGGRLTRDSTVSNTHGICIRRADRVKIAPASITTLNGKYAINVGHVTDYSVQDVVISSVSDGVHINGPADRGLVRNISGDSSDDFVAVIANEYPSQAFVNGDITNLHINDIKRRAGGTSGTAVRVLSGTGSKIRNLHITDVSGVSNRHMVGLIDDGTFPATIGQDTDNVVIRGVTGTPGSGYALVGLQGSGLSGVAVSGLVLDPLASASCLAIAVAGTTGGKLTLDARGVECASGLGNTLISLATGSTWRGVTISGIHFVGKSDKTAGRVLACAASGQGPVKLSGISVVNGNAVCYINPSSGTVILHLSDLHVTGGSSIGVNVAGACAVTGSINGWSETVNPDFGVFGLTVSGATCDMIMTNIRTAAAFYRSLTQTGRVNGADCKLAVDRLTPNAGDMVYNSNASLAVGAGAVVYDGTQWKRVDTSAVKTGTATLVAGTVTVNDAAITANSVIRLGQKTVGGTPGALYVSARSAGVSFSITSTSGTDTSVVQYYIDAY